MSWHNHYASAPEGRLMRIGNGSQLAKRAYVGSRRKPTFSKPGRNVVFVPFDAIGDRSLVPKNDFR